MNRIAALEHDAVCFSLLWSALMRHDRRRLLALETRRVETAAGFSYAVLMGALGVPNFENNRGRLMKSLSALFQIETGLGANRDGLGT